MAQTKTEVKVSAKELRRAAKNAGIEGWEEMGKAELQAALAAGSENGDAKPKAKKSKAKAKKGDTKVKAEKTKTKKSKPTKTVEGGGVNPFRDGSNLHLITEALIHGGKRSELVRKIKNKLDYTPRVQSEAEFDIDLETDRRLKAVGYILKNQYGFEYTHEGRGPDAFIKVVPPSS